MIWSNLVLLQQWNAFFSQWRLLYVSLFTSTPFCIVSMPTRTCTIWLNEMTNKVEMKSFFVLFFCKATLFLFSQIALSFEYVYSSVNKIGCTLLIFVYTVVKLNTDWPEALYFAGYTLYKNTKMRPVADWLRQEFGL